MNISELRDSNELGYLRRSSFIKYRVLNGNNIFPTLFITSIEQLIIKKNYGSAFEIFFGMIYELNHLENSEKIESDQEFISEFTYCMQSKRLKMFRTLQEKQSFFKAINTIGKSLKLPNNIDTINTIAEILKKIKIKVNIFTAVRDIKRLTDDAYLSDIVILQNKANCLVLYEISDFMDDELIEDMLREMRERMEYENRVMRSEDNYIKYVYDTEKKVENREKENMYNEDIYIRKFYDAEKDIGNVERDSIHDELNYTKRIYRTEKRIRRTERKMMENEYYYIIDFIEGEKIIQYDMCKGFKREQRLSNKNGKLAIKIEMSSIKVLDAEEKLMKNFQDLGC